MRGVTISGGPDHEWKDGMMHGINRMWWEDGSMICDVVSSYNEDISGTVWYADGEIQVFGQSEPNSPIEPTWLLLDDSAGFSNKTLSTVDTRH